MRQGRPGGVALPFQVADQFFRRDGVEAGSCCKRGLELVFAACRKGRFGAFEVIADAVREVETAVETLGSPEGQRRGGGPCRAHQHLVVRDAQDLPVLRAQVEGLADGGFPDEFLVQFADQRAGIGVTQRVVAPVRNGAAAVVQGEQGALVGAYRAVDPVKGNARFQFPHAGAGITAREHVQHQVEVLPWQLAIG